MPASSLKNHEHLKRVKSTNCCSKPICFFLLCRKNPQQVFQRHQPDGLHATHHLCGLLSSEDWLAGFRPCTEPYLFSNLVAVDLSNPPQCSDGVMLVLFCSYFCRMLAWLWWRPQSSLSSSFPSFLCLFSSCTRGVTTSGHHETSSVWSRQVRPCIHTTMNWLTFLLEVVIS